MLEKIKYSGEDLYPYERTTVWYQPKKVKPIHTNSKTIKSEEKEDVPIPEKYALSIKEAVAYFGIGERKLRKLVDANEFADWFFMNGTKILIKRKQFEKYLDETSYI